MFLALFIAGLVFFLGHTRFLIKSKGQRRDALLLTTYFLCISGIAGGYVYIWLVSYFPLAPCIGGMLPATMTWFYAQFILQKAEGAPGKEYFSLNFSCPFCKAELEYSRHQEGQKEYCPHCKEIIIVTENEETHQQTLFEHRQALESFEQLEEFDPEAPPTTGPIEFGTDAVLGSYVKSKL